MLRGRNAEGGGRAVPYTRAQHPTHCLGTGWSGGHSGSRSLHDADLLGSGSTERAPSGARSLLQPKHSGKPCPGTSSIGLAAAASWQQLRRTQARACPRRTSPGKGEGTAGARRLQSCAKSIPGLSQPFCHGMVPVPVIPAQLAPARPLSCLQPSDLPGAQVQRSWAHSSILQPLHGCCGWVLQGIPAKPFSPRRKRTKQHPKGRGKTRAAHPTDKGGAAELRPRAWRGPTRSRKQKADGGEKEWDRPSAESQQTW